MSTTLFPDNSAPPIKQFALRFSDEAELPLVNKPLGRDVSALAVFGSTLFCAADEGSTIERLVFDPASGSFQEHQNIALSDFFDLPGGPAGEMDIEGLAVEDDYLWITGSHSLKRHSLDDDQSKVEDLDSIGWDANRGFLGRIPLTKTADGLVELLKAREGAPRPQMMRMGRKGRKGLRKLLRDEPLVQPFMNVPAKENGFDIEGLAVIGRRVVLGLRGPVLGKNSLMVSMQLDAEGEFLEPVVKGGKAYRLHSLDLAGFGIRDLLADGDRLLILAGPTQAIEGVQRVFCIDRFDPKDEVVSKDQVREVLTLPLRGGCDHAEGIARFSSGSEDLLLIDYDSPAEDRYDEASHQLLLDAYPFPR